MALITLALLTPLAIASAILVSQSGGDRGEAASAALGTYCIGSVLVAVPTMCAAVFLRLVSGHDRPAQGLMKYGALMGWFAFVALGLGLLIHSSV